MFVELEAVGTAVQTVELLSKSLPLLKKLWLYIVNGDRDILIVGPGGSGKTTLAKIISGEISSLNPTYDLSQEVENFGIISQVPCRVVTLPGQEAKQYKWDEQLARIKKGEIRGVIHVVSYGYHEIRDLTDITSFRFYNHNDSNAEFLEKYLEDGRQKELRVLDKIIPEIKKASSNNKFWMLTLVSHQDIWWNKRLEVKDYYEKADGEYIKKLQEVSKKLGSNNFCHDFSSASLIIKNFLPQFYQLTSPTVQGYDEVLKLANIQRTLEIITENVKI